ncbi:FAD:protein FMN transferase [Streptosporangiaceae bacterium NEAU-GS5]|nr:FAD:protein FMN transferase [Streptosporangiaceae bacterium NEAU-GS5]
MRHVEHVMGTVFSFDIRHDGDAVRPALDTALTWLHWVDETFSTYRAGSAISRLDTDAVGMDECPAEVAEVLALCESVERASGGYFSLRPQGRLDPSALVKGWAVERASRLLREAGAPRHIVNGGGDIRLGAGPRQDHPWRAGVAHPLRPGRILAVVEGHDLAVATSGVAERGRHIINPHTGRPAGDLVSITVIGDDLTIVDAYATAAFAMGVDAPAWLERTPGVEGMVVTATGEIVTTSGFPPQR